MRFTFLGLIRIKRVGFGDLNRRAKALFIRHAEINIELVETAQHPLLKLLLMLLGGNIPIGKKHRIAGVIMVLMKTGELLPG